MKIRREGPEWYRVYHPEMWDEPDDLERQMIDGCPSMRPWPDHLHEWHCHRRWETARHEYRKANPEFATQEFHDLIESCQRRRAGG